MAATETNLFVVTIDYEDGVNVGVYHYGSESLAKKHVADWLAAKLDDIYEADEGVGVEVAQKLADGDVRGAMEAYNNGDLMDDLIDFNPVFVHDETPAPLEDYKQTATDFLNNYDEDDD